MSYDKHTWGDQKIRANLVTPEKLRHIETQYELALPDARVNNTQLEAQVASTAPTGEQAMVYFNTEDNQLYGYNGTEWVLIGSDFIVI